MNVERMVGDNVRAYREMKRLSQEKLAELAGLHRTYIGQVERAEKNITVRNLYRIGKALKIAPHLLLIPESYKSE
ncbi:MAG: helix-turn-helix domain-containing protein [Candidatus Kapaibacterium sp.]